MVFSAVVGEAVVAAAVAALFVAAAANVVDVSEFFSSCCYCPSRISNHFPAHFLMKLSKYFPALHGPEGHVAKEGQYEFHMTELAVAPEGSDFNDSRLCPKYP